MKGIKILIATIITCTFILTMTGCTKDPAITDEDGNALKYESYEITESGMYVHDKKDDTFTPVLSGFTSYNGVPNDVGILGEIQNNTDIDMFSDEVGRHIWMSDEAANPLKLIPTVDNDNTELVLFMLSGNDEMPEQYIIEKYKNLGWTIGAHVTFGETGDTLFINNKEDCCKNSSAEKKISEASETLLKITDIEGGAGGNTSLLKEAKKHIDRQAQMLTGLKKDCKYKINYYDGTVSNSENVIADTVGFKALSSSVLPNPLKETTKGYFVIKLPANLANGYYYINDNGLFRYKAKN